MTIERPMAIWLVLLAAMTATVATADVIDWPRLPVTLPKTCTVPVRLNEGALKLAALGAAPTLIKLLVKDRSEAPYACKCGVRINNVTWSDVVLDTAEVDVSIDNSVKIIHSFKQLVVSGSYSADDRLKRREAYFSYKISGFRHTTGVSVEAFRLKANHLTRCEANFDKKIVNNLRPSATPGEKVNCQPPNFRYAFHKTEEPEPVTPFDDVMDACIKSHITGKFGHLHSTFLMTAGFKYVSKLPANKTLASKGPAAFLRQSARPVGEPDQNYVQFQLGGLNYYASDVNAIRTAVPKIKSTSNGPTAEIYIDEPLLNAYSAGSHALRRRVLFDEFLSTGSSPEFKYLISDLTQSQDEQSLKGVSGEFVKFKLSNNKIIASADLNITGVPTKRGAAAANATPKSFALRFAAELQLKVRNPARVYFQVIDFEYLNVRDVVVQKSGFDKETRDVVRASVNKYLQGVQFDLDILDSYHLSISKIDVTDNVIVISAVPRFNQNLFEKSMA